MESRWENFGKKISTAMDIFMAENRYSDVNNYRELFDNALLAVNAFGVIMLFRNHCLQDGEIS